MNDHRAIFLSKSKLTAFRQCAKRLWLEVKQPELRLDSAATKRAFDTGHLVGELARREYPDGVLIDRDDGIPAALRDTQVAMVARPKRPVFEATFQHSGVLVMADLLLPHCDAWHLAEVKSSASVKDYHLDDVAIQAWVLRGAGLTVPTFEVRHLDTSFVYPGGDDYRGLFASTDVGMDVEGLQPAVPQWVGDARAVLVGAEPAIPMGPQCTDPFECPFVEYCSALAGPQPEYPVTILPNSTGRKLASALTAEGYGDLREIPIERMPSGKLGMIHAATVTGTPFFDRDNARAALAAAPYPRLYFDFETINLAVPIWACTRPYQQVPFQWSCHVERTRGKFEHAEFLKLSGADPSRRCAERLLAVLATIGTIIAYNASFEKTVLKGLADRFPDLTTPLNALLPRFIDLLPVTRETYYHRDMRGSWSIKAVLPTIAPDLDYERLGEVRDGSAAQEAFREAIAPDTGADRRAQLDGELRRYCALDTWAMVVLAWFLEGRGRPPEASAN